MILHSDDIEIDVSDSIVAWAVDLFIFFFKGLVLPGIVHNIEHKVPDHFNSDMDAFAKNSHGIYDTKMNNLAFDFSYSSPQEVSTEHLQLFFNGTVFNDTTGEFVPKLGAADMQVDGTTKEAI